ncbi:MAG: OmpH family outer membrane protein [Pirellulaceae bacterium]|nr:OmpH family outer membrane protein [Pirellulaceae bacterium]
MQRLARITFLSAGLVVFGIAPAIAQQPPRTGGVPPISRPTAVAPATAPAATPAAGGVQIAVIDVSYVFKNFQRFNQRMEGMKQEVETFEGELRNQQKSIVDVAQKMKEYNPNSPEYKNLEETATRQRVALQTQAELKKKDILEDEAQSYYEAYTEIQNVVTAIADRHGIGLVLRFDREEISPDDRSSVLRGVNRAIVFQRNLDITDMVLETLNRPVATGRAPIGPAGPGVRPR